jgi:outer membrane receptor protein involved in Fe transport
VLGVGASLRLPDGWTDVTLFADDLLNRQYVVAGTDLSDTFGNALRNYGPPRTFGFEVRRRF